MRSIRFICFVLVALSLLFDCVRNKEERTAEHSISGGVEGQTSAAVRNYDSLLTVLDKLSESVSANPQDRQLRLSLLDTAYDTLGQRIFAAGRGKPAKNARTPAVAMKMAERAATIDAYRWAARIKKWHDHPELADEQELSAELPGAQILSQRTLPDSTVVILIEMNALKIQ